MADPSNQVPPALPTGQDTSPPAALGVPASAGGGAPTTGTTPPPGFPDWLLLSEFGGYVDYIPDRPGATTWVPANPQNRNTDPTTLQSPVRLYRLSYLFGIKQTGASWVNAIAYLLLVEAQKNLWNGVLSSLSSMLSGSSTTFTAPPPVPTPLPTPAPADPVAPPSQPPNTTDPDDPNWYNNALDQRNANLLSGPMFLHASDATAEPEQGPSVIPIAQRVLTQLKNNNVDPSAVAAYIASKAVSAQDQRALLAAYCGTTEPVAGMHRKGRGEQHAMGGAIDIEPSSSHYIPMKNAGGQILADASSYNGFGVTNKATGAGGVPTATDFVFTPCLKAYDNACQAMMGKNNPAICGGGDQSRAQITARFADIMTLHVALTTYFAQPGHDDDRTAALHGSINQSAKYDPSTTTVVPESKNFWPPEKGIIGFNETIVQALYAAVSPDLSGMSYKFRWMLFNWSADLMHFDIEHNPSGGYKPLDTTNGATTMASRDDVLTAQSAVETRLSVTQSDGQNPWSQPPPSQSSGSP